MAESTQAHETARAAVAAAIDATRRRHLRRRTFIAAGTLCFSFTLIYLWLDASFAAIVVAVAGATMLGGYVAERSGRYRELASALASVAGVGTIFALARNLGGIESPVLMWIVFPPMTAYMLQGRVALTVTAAGCVTAIVALALWPGERLVSDATLQVLRIITYPSIAAMGLTLAVQFERARRVSDDMLERALDEAQAANRLKSEFVASVSHEVRTPLHGMLGMTDMLLATGLDEQQRELARSARTAAQSLNVLFDDLLDASRLDAGRLALHPAPAHVDEVARAVVDMFVRRAAERGVPVTLDVQPELPRVVVDAGRLRQVLTNLVDNAVKFTNEGRVSVTLRWEKSGDSVDITLTVEDTGIGIPAAQADAIFERFRQGDSSSTRRYGGTGLGLAIARDLMALMGGTLTLDRASPGSLFRVAFSAPLAGGDVTLKGARVLLAEDNVVNQRLAVHLLESLGCAVDVASDGAEAVRLVGEHRYDVVLMDCHMPQMDGYRAAAAIRAKLGRALPILALTAGGSADDVERAREAGMDGFLTKPIDAEGMRASIAGVIARVPAASADTTPI